MVINNKKKGQSFSVDVLVVIVILLFGVIFLVANQVNNKKDTTNLLDVQNKVAEQSRVIFEKLKSDNVLDSENNVNVENLMQVDIDSIKEELNINNDFCIVFEKDGYLVKIDPENNINGIGSSNIIVNGVPCKSS